MLLLPPLVRRTLVVFVFVVAAGRARELISRASGPPLLPATDLFARCGSQPSERPKSIRPLESKEINDLVTHTHTHTVGFLLLCLAKPSKRKLRKLMAN